ncbi:hypothetical protein HGRIS_002680 [Hohenbuehelia grisea]|uniref:Csf1 N-terminal domain-containing protein n=1 Tax=Hohenbuehelia grisea TaxID=104357 RepID=A0ABR3JL67_9AGAR
MLETLLLITCICIVIAVILYLFYWNRVVAFLLSLLFRVAFWNQGASRIWVEIGAIHISLITGRILLKEVSYHSSNQTIRIVKAQIEWRYWIRRPTLEEDIGVSFGTHDLKQSKPSRSCRVQVTLHGLECFMYNRTPAYESIIDHIMGNRLNRPSSRGTEMRWSSRKGSVSFIGSKVPTFAKRAGAWARSQLPSLDPKDLLPLGIEITKGVIIAGNKSTPQHLLAEFKRAAGTFGVVQSRSKHDLHKQLLDLKFLNAIVRFKKNDDYHEPMVSSGEKVQSRMQKYSRFEKASQYLRHAAFTKLWHQLKLFALTRPDVKTGKHPQPLPSSAKAGTKSVDAASPPREGFALWEYAEESRILEAPVLDLSYYVDVVGEVPPPSAQTEPTGVESIDIGNGGLPPQWGIDLMIRNGILRYGPWADRQRIDLQRAFFPQVFSDILPTPHLSPGDERMWTNLRIFIELLDNTTLHIPFREPSKDWQWDGLTKDPFRPKKREPAWIHVSVGDRSSINYMAPMVAGPEGYDPLLEVHLDTVEITSSLNDIRLVSAETCRVRAEMPSPLKWNAERKWVFGVTLRQPVLYLLRDHINMVTDLVRDWTTGPPHDYYRFVPMIYSLELEMHRYEANFYANDQNIIDKPLIKDDNAFLILRGNRFKTEVEIPSNVFRPDTTIIPFSLEVPDVSLDLSLPRWHTSALHTSPERNNIGHAAFFRVDASYRYFAEVRENNIERLKLDFQAKQVAFKALGWSIRYFMVMRDNYFGSFTHFSTLFEYLDKRKGGIPPGDPILAKYRPGKSNAFEVDMTVTATDSIMIAPAGLPGYETSPAVRIKQGDVPGVGPSLVLSIPEIQVQLRVHDYYMDMSLNMDTISGFFVDNFQEKVSRKLFSLAEKASSVVIDGINIVADRLFGPQPRTATYVCIWEVQVGAVKGILSAWDGQILVAALNAFRLNYIDAANAPAAEDLSPADPDITFLKFALGNVDVVWRANAAALALIVPTGLTINLNDQPGQYHRKVTSIRLPELQIKLLHACKQSWTEVAAVSGDVYLDIYAVPHGWKDSALAQEKFVKEQDALTRRAARMLGGAEISKVRHKGGVYLPQPRIARPRKANSDNASPRRVSRSHLGSGRWQKLSDLSESDVEEGVSEATRDARLAKTREATPLPLHRGYEDDQSIGDESDDEDLTPGESSDSDFPDEDIPSGSARRLYSKHLRRFTTHSLDRPVLWDSSAFSLLKDRERIISAAPPANPRDIPTMPKRPKTNNASPFDVSIVKLQCQRDFEFILTPLVTPVLFQLEESMRSKLLSPELHIDAIFAEHMSSFSKSLVPKETIVDLDIKGARIIALQHAILPGEKSPACDPPLPLTTVIALDCRIDRCRLVYHSNGAEPSLQASLQQLYFQVTPTNSTRNPRLLRRVASTLLTGLSVVMAQEDLEVFWNEFSMTLDPNGPEYMIALGLALKESFAALNLIWSRWRSYSSTLIQDIVHDVIQGSENIAIVDELSTIQPSYFVQRGIAHDLRDDSTLRFLFHLRSCLWMIDDRRAFRSLRKGTTSLNMRDTLKLLEKRFLSLTLDIEGSHIPLLRKLEETLFPSRRHIPSAKATPNISSASFRWKTVAFLIPSPSGGATSEVIIRNTSIASRQRLYGLDSNPPELARAGSELSQCKRFSLVISIQGVDVALSPYLMVFAHNTLRLRRQHSRRQPERRNTSPVPVKSIPSNSSLMDSNVEVEMCFSLHRFRLLAAAQNLTFDFSISGFGTTARLLSYDGKYSMNSALKSSNVSLQARSPKNPAESRDKDILASLSLSGVKVTAVARQDTDANPHLRCTFSLDEIALDVPRSALRLYRFAEEWKADFFPGIESMLQALLEEMKGSTSQVTGSPIQPPKTLAIHYQLQGTIKIVSISLQVMLGTWVSWKFSDALLSLQSSSAFLLRPSMDVGLQVPSQIVSITSGDDREGPEMRTRVKFAIPQISLAGRVDSSSVRISMLIDEFHSKVKAAHLHTLLAVQQKFGQDFNDLVALVQETQSKRPSSPNPVRSKPSSLKYQLHLKIRGFRVGLQGLTSILFLECKNIYGGLENTNGSTWHIGLSDLAFSLAPRSMADKRTAAFSRTLRSAFVVVDLSVSTHRRESSDPQNLDDLGFVLKIDIPKVHAVMQPSSIGEVGDFIDHIQAEILSLQEQRALELAALRERTKQVMKTFEVPAVDRDEPTGASPPWFKKYTVDISMRNFGVAFPLTLEHGLDLPQAGYRPSNAVRAFLFSIRSIHFGAQRGERGQAIMKDFTFQFVPRFRQSVASDFSGENHFTRNRLVYPEMTAQVRSETSSISRKIQVGASVSGFVLDLDSSIPEYVFSLVDVYRQGKERIERLATNAPRTPITPRQQEPDDTSLQKRYKAVPTSNILASLTFLSGKVRVHSGTAPSLGRSKSYSHDMPSDPDVGDDILELPVVSVWAEYRATPAAQKLLQGLDVEPSMLMFKSTIHSSENTLKPTLLPFITELTRHVETRMRKVSSQAPHPPKIVTTPSSSTFLRAEHVAQPVSSMRISFSLRIDQSKLELTCQPDVNVIAGLHWNSGGFIVNISPGARNVTFSGCVTGLTVGLKHGFLSEDCVRLDAKNLSFSVTFSKMHESISSVSMVIDTECSGAVHFSRFQDVLCFKAVWLDRIPILTAQGGTIEVVQPTKQLPATPIEKQDFTTAVLVRIREIKLNVDLGHSISAITLDLKDSLLRTKITESSHELSISVRDVALVACGNVSGIASVPNCVFQTVRRREAEAVDNDGSKTMLELRMTSGSLAAMLESEHQRLLSYRAEPLEIEVRDDWSKVSSKSLSENNPLRLSFVVSCANIIAAVTVNTIPKLLLYANKFKANLQAQRDGASRESKTFRVTRTPKPDNPLSAVANAMLSSARSRFKDAETGLSYVINQYMSLTLGSLRLMVFPRTMNDLEVAGFVARGVHARLDRLVEAYTLPSKRDLRLSFAGMTISRFHQLNSALAGDFAPLDGQQWLTALLKDAAEATIIGLPSMRMHMKSEEEVRERTFLPAPRSLVYDFDSRFVRREGMSDVEDIFITLNMALYSWLTVLRKGLAREMEQVQVTTDWRGASPLMASPAIGGRKKAPDPLQLVDAQKSAASPRSSMLGPPSTATLTTGKKSGRVDQVHSAAPSRTTYDLQTPQTAAFGASQIPFPQESDSASMDTGAIGQKQPGTGISYRVRHRNIERLTMRQLGEATPDVRHPFFAKKAGFNLEDSLPQYVHEYATVPLEEIMEVLLKLYSRQLLAGKKAESA